MTIPAAPGYPDGYRDPPWDGTEAGFAADVLPARIEAITQLLNEQIAAAGYPALRFEWKTTKPEHPR